MQSIHFGPTVTQVQKALDNLVLYHERRLRNLEADYRRALDTETREALFNVERAIVDQKVLLSRIPRHVVRTFVVRSLNAETEECYALSTGSTGFKVSLEGWAVHVVGQQGLWQVTEIAPGSICEYGLVVSVNGGPKISEPAIDAAIQAYWDHSNLRQSRSDAVQRRWHEKEVEARSQRRVELKLERHQRAQDEAERRRRFDEVMSPNNPAPPATTNRQKTPSGSDSQASEKSDTSKSKAGLMDRAKRLFKRK